MSGLADRNRYRNIFARRTTGSERRVRIKPLKLRGLVIAVIAVLALSAGPRPALATEDSESVAERSLALLSGTPGNSTML